MTDKKNLIEPRTLQGFMELLPKDQILFNQIQETVKKGFERFGFLPLDTPVLEYASVLLAKAGGETEKQIYRAVNKNSDTGSENKSELVMRFDLTVPLAKYVAKNYHELAFPFRRYQIGKVYRGERPQKGRFREFYQCDIDCVGDGSLDILTDAEMPAVIYTVFKELGFTKFKIYISNRKILTGFLEAVGLKNKITEISVIIDKIQKIGEKKAEEELSLLGVDYDKIKPLLNLVVPKYDVKQIIWDHFENLNNETFLKGIEELEQVIKGMHAFGIPEENFEIDLKIVRGLDYYTGTVYETFLEGHENIGSVCSGGRYDDLAAFYTDKKLPGVGISIGLTRLYDKLSEVIGQKSKSVAKVLVFSPDGQMDACLKAATAFRKMGINTQVYLESGKMKKKFQYAERLNIPFAAIIGESEAEAGTVTLKNLETGEQFESISVAEATELLR